MNMVLVTGASGFIGSHIVKTLIDAGFGVRAVYRREHPPYSLTSIGSDHLSLIRMDISDPRSDLDQPCAGVDSVVHAAAKAGDWGSPDAFHKINVNATEMLVRAAERQGVRKFVYVSSIAVHGFGNHRGTTEEGPYFPLISPYQRTKLEAEKIVLDRCSSFFSVTVLRPGNVYGPGDTTTFFPIFEAMQKGIMGYLGNGNTLTSIIYVSDLVDAIHSSLVRNEAHGEVFNILSDDTLTWKILLEIAAKYLKVNPPRIHLSRGFSKILAAFFSGLYSLFGIRSFPPITRYRVDQLTNDYHFSNFKAKDLLGFNPRVDVYQGMERTISDFNNRCH